MALDPLRGYMASQSSIDDFCDFAMQQSCISEEDCFQLYPECAGYLMSGKEGMPPAVRYAAKQTQDQGESEEPNSQYLQWLRQGAGQTEQPPPQPQQQPAQPEGSTPQYLQWLRQGAGQTEQAPPQQQPPEPEVSPPSYLQWLRQGAGQTTQPTPPQTPVERVPLEDLPDIDTLPLTRSQRRTLKPLDEKLRQWERGVSGITSVSTAGDRISQIDPLVQKVTDFVNGLEEQPPDPLIEDYVRIFTAHSEVLKTRLQTRTFELRIPDLPRRDRDLRRMSLDDFAARADDCDALVSEIETARSESRLTVIQGSYVRLLLNIARVRILAAWATKALGEALNCSDPAGYAALRDNANAVISRAREYSQSLRRTYESLQSAWHDEDDLTLPELPQFTIPAEDAVPASCGNCPQPPAPETPGETTIIAPSGIHIPPDMQTTAPAPSPAPSPETHAVSSISAHEMRQFQSRYEDIETRNSEERVNERQMSRETAMNNLKKVDEFLGSVNETLRINQYYDDEPVKKLKELKAKAVEIRDRLIQRIYETFNADVESVPHGESLPVVQGTQQELQNLERSITSYLEKLSAWEGEINADSSPLSVTQKLSLGRNIAEYRRQIEGVRGSVQAQLEYARNQQQLTTLLDAADAAVSEYRTLASQAQEAVLAVPADTQCTAAGRRTYQRAVQATANPIANAERTRQRAWDAITAAQNAYDALSPQLRQRYESDGFRRMEMPSDVQTASFGAIPAGPESPAVAAPVSNSPREMIYSRDCPPFIPDGERTSANRLENVIQSIFIQHSQFLSQLNAVGMMLNAELSMKINDDGYITEIRVIDLHADDPEDTIPQRTYWNAYQSVLDKIWTKIRLRGGRQELRLNFMIMGASVTVTLESE